MPQTLENLVEIQNVAKALLCKADVNERLPTPVDDLVAAAGLLEDADYVLSESKIRQAPKELRRLLRSAGRKIRGALDRRERILHINPSVYVPTQRQFIRCHETMHEVIPWQRDLLIFGDTGKTLAPDIELRFEKEANRGAAELLFQLDLLTRISRDYPTDISSPVALAQMFGASIHATLRRWVELHPGAACCIVLQPEPVSVSPLMFQRFELVESGDWKHLFGQERFPRRLSATEYSFLGSLSPSCAGELDLEWTLSDVTNTGNILRVQSFSNGYRTFVLLWLPGKESFIARHRRRPQIIFSAASG